MKPAKPVTTPGGVHHNICTNCETIMTITNEFRDGLVDMVCPECGFASLNSLISLFKKETQ